MPAMSNAEAAPPAAVAVSHARAEASRKNGAKSSGPKTQEGKARAAQNALRHGLRAQKYLVLPEEDGAEFAALEAAMVAELAPVGALQTVLARRVAVAAWRLARADRLEVEVFEERGYGNASPGLALMRDGNGTRSFETLLRYRGAAMAEFWRALKTLKALQAEQARDAEKALDTDAALAPPTRPAARPQLARHQLPNEPGRAPMSAPEPRLEFLLPDPPAPGALHEPAPAWTPNEPETVRHGASASAARTHPQRAPDPTLTGESGVDAECRDRQMEPASNQPSPPRRQASRGPQTIAGTVGLPTSDLP
jgi:hypothetical protein